MLSVTQAFDKLLAVVSPLEAVALPLSDVLGLTLAEDISASEDSPPFDKSLMDGFAVRAADVANGFVSLKVVEVVTAGRVPSKPVGPGEATQIMTGAPIPEGADLVVKIEETLPDIDSVHVTTKSVTPGTNILRQGTSVRAGDVVLKAGMKLNGSRIGALAELGRAVVKVHRRPTVAVLATGDELVPIDETPGPGQIRNSNESMLVAQIQAAGAIPIPLGIARDNRDDLRAKIQQGLQYDVLVLSGGVSAGTLDLVPSELTAEGVREVFHKVELKPGKPVWFGVRDAYEFGKFTLETWLQTIQRHRHLFSTMKDSVSPFPGLKNRMVASQFDDAEADTSRKESIIKAMTPEERLHFDQIHNAGLQRIAHESKTDIADVREVLEEARQMASVTAETWKEFDIELVRASGGKRSRLLPACYVFGLPGNPVSSLVCCELFVRTAIRRLMGEQPLMPRPMPAKLEHDYSARADRPTYHPAKLMWSPEGAVVKLVPWHGSSDLCGTVAANAMAFLSGEAKEYHAGDVLEVIAW